MGGDIVTIVTSDPPRAREKLRTKHGVEPRQGPEGRLIIETAHGDQFIPQMMTTLANGSSPVDVLSVNLSRPTLEDVFIKLTGHAIREEEAGTKDRLRLQTRIWRR